MKIQSLLCGEIGAGFRSEDHVGSYLYSEEIARCEAMFANGVKKFGGRRQMRAANAFVPVFDRPLIPEDDAEVVESDAETVVLLHESEVSIKPFPSLADTLRGLATAEKPFENLVNVSKDLYAVLSGNALDSRSRKILTKIAMILDAASSLDPRVTMIHTFGQSARIAADTLDGIEITEADAASLVTASQNVMALKRDSKASIVTATNIALKDAARHGVDVVDALKHALLSESPPRSSERLVEKAAGATRQGWSGGHASSADGAAPERIANSPVTRGTDFIAFHYFRSIENKAASVSKGEAVEPADIEAAHQPPLPAADVDVPAKDVTEEADSFYMTYEEAGSGNDVDAPPPKVTPILTDVAASSAASYAWIGSVPMRLHRAPNETPQWRMVDLEPYRVEVPRPVDSVFFDFGGRQYVHLDGHAYAVRTLQQDSHWLVSRSDNALPHLPLAREVDGTWGIQEPVFDNVVDDTGALAAEDGIVRRAGEKFIHLQGKLVMVRRSIIDGEVVIQHFAEQPVDTLQAPDDMGIFHLENGVKLIEGEHGYYRLIADAEEGQFYLSNTMGDVKVLAAFSLDKKRWSVVNVNRMFSHLGLEPAPLEAGAEQQPPPVEEPAGAADAERSPQASASGGESLDEGPVMALSPSTKRYQRRSQSVEFAEARHLIAAEKIAFFTDRPRLAKVVDKSLKAIQDMALLTSNLGLVGEAEREYWWVDIKAIRSEIAWVAGRGSNWVKKSILEKQAIYAEATNVVLNNGIDEGFPPVAHCNEMADLMFHSMRQKAVSKKNILQIFFKESTGMTHVLILFAEDSWLMNTFGNVGLRAQSTQAQLPKLNKDAFVEWIFLHRKKVVLLDAWGEKKVLDFSDMLSENDVRAELDAFVKSADFTDVQQRYDVQVVVPQDPKMLKKLP